MGDMTIGIALFVLIIVIGLAIGLHLSSTTPQRRAVVVAFGAMAVVAVLFYVFAMNASQLWTAPVFAVACIVVPIGAYTLVMRAAGPEKKVVSRRSANEAPKPVRADRYPRPSRTGSALDATVMPVTPSHPVNEYLSLQPQDEVATTEGPEVLETSEIADADVVEAPMGADGESGVAAAAEVASEPLAMEETEGAGEILAEVADDELPASEFEAGPTAMREEIVDADASRAEAGASVGAETDAGEPESHPTAAEAFIEEYLVEQNEDESGLFEPEAAPVLQPKKESSPVTSTMMVTIPFSEGDERYLVVSESTSVPNPIMAYKRTTSSHLVPLGSAKHAPREKTPLHGRPDTAHDKASATVPEAPVFEQTAMSWEEPPAAKIAPVAAASAAPVPEPAPEPEPALEFEPRPEVAPEPQPEFAPQPEPVRTLQSEPVLEPSVAATPQPEPEVASAPQPEPAPAPQPEPAPAPQPEPAPAIPAERFQEALDKAQSLRDRGLYPVAARLYAEAAQSAPTGDARRHARFEEIACYVKTGQNDKARALAAELRASNVLTRVERIKLDAIERMG